MLKPTRTFLTENRLKTLSYITNKALLDIDQMLFECKGKAFVSFSGGKDSVVLMHLVNQVNKDIRPVFVDTGIEYPEILEYNQRIANIIILKPKYNYLEVIKKHGFCVLSKEISNAVNQIKTTKSKETLHKYLVDPTYKLRNKYHYLIDAPFKISARCCFYLKKHPFLELEKKTGFKSFTGYKRSDSKMRNLTLRTTSNKRSYMPILEWTESQVWEYILLNNLEYVNLYKHDLSSSCMPCLNGIQFDKCPNKFQRMKETFPEQYDLYINKVGLGFILSFLGFPY